jgi:hypothetical protein
VRSCRFCCFIVIPTGDAPTPHVIPTERSERRDLFAAGLAAQGFLDFAALRSK